MSHQHSYHAMFVNYCSCHTIIHIMLWLPIIVHVTPALISCYVCSCHTSNHIMLSCQGTEPVEELKYNFRYSRCFFAAVLSRLEPLILSTSCMFAEARHEPGMIWWLVFSASIAAFWSAGYRIRTKLCRMTQTSTMIVVGENGGL